MPLPAKEDISLKSLRYCIVGLEFTIARNRAAIDKPRVNPYLNTDPSVFVQGYLYALNCELLLKYIISRIPKKLPKIHKLDLLFNVLDTPQKRNLSEALGPNFEKDLKKFSNYFVTQRYLFESLSDGKVSIDVEFLYRLREALHRLAPSVRASNPQQAQTDELTPY